jgi:hypothetical protein
MDHHIIAGSALVAALLVGLPPQHAQARIVCDREFQANSGHATPHCADQYLAQVARSYGMRVSAADIGSPSTKRSVCEFIGNDNRVYGICSGWRTDRGGPGRN